MDVLKHYSPPIDWQAFQRGALSEDVWAEFKDLVLLCHAFKYWQDAAGQRRRERRPVPLYAESDYMRRKGRREWQGGLKKLEGHQMRAAYLADGKLSAIANLGSQRKGTADWNFSLALATAVGTEVLLNPTAYERAPFHVLAFDRFIAADEVQGEPTQMADEWRRRAGMNNL